MPKPWPPTAFSPQVFRVSPAQFAALFLYCEEITGKNEDGSEPDQLYTVLTTAQRAAAAAETEEGKEEGASAEAVLQALEPLTRTIQEYFASDVVPAVEPSKAVLFRGANYEVPLEDAQGRAVTTHPWHCLSSASLSATAAKAFLKPGGTLFVLRSGRAKAIFFLSPYIKEMECLLAAGRFLIRDALPVAMLRMMGIQVLVWTCACVYVVHLLLSVQR